MAVVWAMKLFSSILWGYKNIKSNFYGVRNYLAKKTLDEVIDQRLKEKLTDTWNVNHLNGMKITWDNLVSFHRSSFMHRYFWMGY